MNIELNREDSLLLAAALKACTPSGGGSKWWSLYQRLGFNELIEQPSDQLVMEAQLNAYVERDAFNKEAFDLT